MSSIWRQALLNGIEKLPGLSDEEDGGIVQDGAHKMKHDSHESGKGDKQ